MCGINPGLAQLVLSFSLLQGSLVNFRNAAFKEQLIWHIMHD